MEGLDRQETVPNRAAGMLVVLHSLEEISRKLGALKSPKCVGGLAAVDPGPYRACAPSGPIPPSPNPVPLTWNVSVCGLGDTSCC